MAPRDDMITIRPHPDYHIEGGDLHLLVDKVRFRVHSYFFIRESSIFKDSLVSTTGKNETRNGSSDANALVLEQVTAEQFSQFLWVLYDPSFMRNNTEANWTTILDLAHRWKFHNVKTLAITSLEKIDIDLIKRIALYEKYSVPVDILHVHYATLCARADPPTLDEVKILGDATSHMIFSIRENLLRSQKGVRAVDQFDKSVLLGSITSYFGVKEKGTASSVINASTQGGGPQPPKDPDPKKNKANGHGGNTRGS
ncbi:hypothetical protein AMATHDRAFT_50335 [Amanita thiersii Skay4041]|uniref:BTB domain-containing protein n=1 Tax=Amanita thiersii Skay4041 TaxID=703135 RepID=A0A2A9NI78_9AGAR|nr:hypothetical protein AMATHDRAFT_50335 [Amanita thiersii Skay4041]